jgi:hypothetical protein
MIYDGSNNDEIFEKNFNKFVELNLIRDWDFACYTTKTIDEKYRDHLDKVASNHKLVPRAKTFILYQTKYPIKIKDQALFEIAILEKDNYIDLELPLTTMKVKVSHYNLLQIFMMAKLFSSKDKIDINAVKHIIKDMKIIIPKHKDGLFDMDELYKDELSKEILDIITNFAKKDLNLQQFLITHIVEPNRLFYRFIEKNIPKVEKIKEFLASLSKTTNNSKKSIETSDSLFNSVSVDSLDSLDSII